LTKLDPNIQLSFFLPENSTVTQISIIGNLKDQAGSIIVAQAKSLQMKISVRNDICLDYLIDSGWKATTIG
jgi:hypothetical protein